MDDVRRAPGTGTAARLRADGRYECRVTVGRKGKRQVQRSFFGVSAAEAERKRDEAVRQLAGGIILAGEKVTVERYLRDWLEVKRGAVRASTWTRYRGIVTHNIIPAIGSVPLAKLTPEAVERMLASLGRSPRTAHHVRAVLRTALARAVRHGALLRNVAAHAETPKIEEDEQPVLSPDDIHRFLQQVKGDRWEALYVVAIATGLRQGEILGLRWQDVDLEAGSVRVVNQMYLRELVPPKTKKSRRMVGISASVISVLRSHQLRQEQQRRFLVRGDWGNNVGLVFTNGMGGPVHGPHVTREFQRHLERAGLPKMPFHSLRHTAVSMLMAVGVDEKVRQQILGHSDAAMTRHYTHVLPEALRDAAERMEKVIAG
jgi:integrase